jgi:hypothetical protein
MKRRTKTAATEDAVDACDRCEVCGCTEDAACEGGCAWDDQYGTLGRMVCTTQRCLTVAGQRDARLAKKHGS